MVLVDGERYGEDDLIAAIDAGAEDVREDGDAAAGASAQPSDLSAVRKALEGAGVEVASAELAMEPKSTVEVEGTRGRMRCCASIDALEEHDDVNEVHANFDVPEEILRAGDSGSLGPGHGTRITVAGK